MQGLIIPGRRDAELQGSLDYLCDNTSNKSRQTEKQGVLDIYVHCANSGRPALVTPIWMICVSTISLNNLEKKKSSSDMDFKSLGSNEE